MSKSNLVAFRVPAELQDAFNQAVEVSGGDKTAWLLDALRCKLNQPESNPDSRMLALVERMENAAAALAGGKQGIPPHSYDERCVIAVVVDTLRQGIANGRVIAERINDAGYQTLAGKAWDKDIYSVWKRRGDIAAKITAALAQ